MKYLKSSQTLWIIDLEPPIKKPPAFTGGCIFLCSETISRTFVPPYSFA